MNTSPKQVQWSIIKDSKNVTNEELLETKCDILIPAALENQITKD